MSEIMLGQLARDRITGFEGTITRRLMYFDGSVQFAIQPRVEKDKTGTHPKAVTFDTAQIEVITGPSHGVTAQPYLQEVNVSLGEEVQDMATGFSGITKVRHDFINGCVYFEVQPKAKKGEKYPEAEMIEHFTLKRVGAGVSKLMPKVKGALESKSATPVPRAGGPSVELDDRTTREL